MKRLNETSGDALGLSVLRSARIDAPSDEARERAARALGIVAAVAAVGTGAVVSASASAGVTASASGGASVSAGALAAGAVAAQAGSAASAGSALTAVAGASLVVKSTIALLVTGVLAAGALTIPAAQKRAAERREAALAQEAFVHASRGAPDTGRGGGATLATAPAVTPAPSVGLPSADPIPSSAPVALVTAAPVPPPAPVALSASPVATVAPPVASSRDLTQAMSLLDSARTALEARDAPGALAVLDTYDRQFPKGALSPEAAVLRIEALVAAGRQDAAVSAADRFLAASPESPHARRVRALVAAARGGARIRDHGDAFGP